MTEKLSSGVVHSVPADLRGALVADAEARRKWEEITPLARNEWICWVTSVKRPETRRQHVERVCSELKEGMRRPCCWPGCPHRMKDGGRVPEEQRPGEMCLVDAKPPRIPAARRRSG